MSNELLLHEMEIERLKQEIHLAKDLNTPTNVELPMVEIKHKELNFSNNIHDDDEMVCIFTIVY